MKENFVLTNRPSVVGALRWPIRQWSLQIGMMPHTHYGRTCLQPRRLLPSGARGVYWPMGPGLSVRIPPIDGQTDRDDCWKGGTAAQRRYVLPWHRRGMDTNSEHFAHRSIRWSPTVSGASKRGVGHSLLQDAFMLE